MAPEFIALDAEFHAAGQLAREAADAQDVAQEVALLAQIDRDLCCFATSLARSSKVAVSAWMRVSPKPMIVSGRLAITRTPTGSPPAGV
jgi:hypothetical protein